MARQTAAQALAKGTMWNAFERFSLLGIQLLCTFVLARFLTPADFGIVGMLVVFTQIAHTLVDSGFAVALIREREVTDLDFSSVFHLNMAIAVVIYVVLCLCAPWIADFYHEPRLADISRVTFLIVPLVAMQVVQTAIFQRQLLFKRLSVIAFVASTVSSVVAIVAAWWLRNVWALVLQNVLTYAIKTLLLWVATPWRPHAVFSWTPIRRYFRFSHNLLLSGLIGNVFNNINAILIGHFYTATDLGLYSQAHRINDVAAHQMTGVVRSVSYPVLARVSNTGGNLKAGYRKVILVTLLFVGTVEMLLMSTSRDLLVLLMGGEQWRTAGRYLFILGIAGTLFPLHSINQNILNVKGMGRTILRLEVTRRCILVAILAVTVRFDVEVFVWGFSFYSFVLLFLNLHYCGRPIGYSLGEQLRDITPMLLRLAACTASALAVTESLEPGLVRLLCSAAVAAAVWAVLFHGSPVVRDIAVLVRGLVRKSPRT